VIFHGTFGAPGDSRKKKTVNWVARAFKGGPRKNLLDLVFIGPREHMGNANQSRKNVLKQSVVFNPIGNGTLGGPSAW
jgi:hypothetical protein